NRARQFSSRRPSWMRINSANQATPDTGSTTRRRGTSGRRRGFDEGREILAEFVSPSAPRIFGTQQGCRENSHQGKASDGSSPSPMLFDVHVEPSLPLGPGRSRSPKVLVDEGYFLLFPGFRAAGMISNTSSIRLSWIPELPYSSNRQPNHCLEKQPSYH